MHPILPLSYFTLLHIYSVYSSPLWPKNEFTFHNSHIPQLNAYCKIAFFVQQIFVVGLVHLYTEYRCQLPSVYYLTRLKTEVFEGQNVPSIVTKRFFNPKCHTECEFEYQIIF